MKLEIESINIKPDAYHSSIIDPDYLERRMFVCPDCHQAHLVYVYERNNNFYIRCMECGGRFSFDWGSERFVEQDREIYFKEL